MRESERPHGRYRKETKPCILSLRPEWRPDLAILVASDAE